ncbi:dynamin family protein [Nostoc linckia]|jgi:GTPase SAR1 family protein|nr:dynamin family protein [Nostoc linckia]
MSISGEIVMPIDHGLLRQLKAKPAVKQTGVGALPRGIHKTPELREWVTLESVALPPVLFNQEGHWRLISLLTVSKQLEDGSKGWLAPWGAVEWSWPEEKVVQKIDLRSREDTASLRNSKTIPARPAGCRIVLEPRLRTQRENALFSALDRILLTPPAHQVDLASLAAHYAGLLPVGVYPYYHALIPECRKWLRSEVAAFTLTASGSSEQALTPDNSSIKVKPPEAVMQTDKSSGNRFQHPTDLTERIGSWLRKCLMLAESSELENMVSELQALEARSHLPGFRLAMVGEFNRGKSTLINRLLGRSLVPVGTLSTTAILTSIIAGVEECMEVRFSKEHSEVRSLQESSWSDLLATDLAGSDRQVVARVQLTVDDPWLRSLDVELIDAPGIGDLNGHYASLVFDLLNRCDAAILVVSAITPFGMGEGAFLKQEMIGRHIDRILIVVSHLDTIAQEQRARVLAHIRGRVAEVSENITILPLHPVDDTTEAMVLNAVRTQIAAMVSKGDRRAWRSQKVAGQLADHLSQMSKIGEAAIAAARMNPVEREKALQRAQSEAKKAELHWQKICRELDKRCQQCYQQLKEKILSAKTELLDVLSFELSRTSNPKLWWERELPFRLRREFPSLSRKSEDFFMKAIARDFAWLQNQVSHSFSIQMTSKAANSLALTSEPLDISYKPSQLEMSDIQQYRFLTRIGSSAAMVGSYIFGGPAGIVASLGTTYLSERLMNEKLEEQRQMVAQALEPSVDRALEEYCSAIYERLHHFYRELSDDTKHQQATWQSARNTAVNNNSFVAADEPAWRRMIDTASALKTEIVTALQQ